MKDDKTFNDADESTSRRGRNRIKREAEYEDDLDPVDYEDDGDEEAYTQEDEEYDEESYDEDEEDDEEYDEEDSDDGYDDGEDEDYDDVFSLEDDLKREQRKQFIQYVCVALAAVAIVAFALFASVKLTQKRVEDEKNSAAAAAAAAALAAKALDEQTAGDAPAVFMTSDWPSQQFPDVPVFESPAYETTVKDGYASVSIPSSATDGYAAYLDTLTGEHNAAVYLNTDKLSVLNMNGIEIHLLSGNQQNRVVLCDEMEIQFNDVDYRAFDLPTGFKLVSANADSAMGRVLTYRLASVDKALEYAGSLVNQYGWRLAGSFDMSEQTFYAVYTKNNLQMTLDYYSSSDDFTIKLDYVN